MDRTTMMTWATRMMGRAGRGNPFRGGFVGFITHASSSSICVGSPVLTLGEAFWYFFSGLWWVLDLGNT